MYSVLISVYYKEEPAYFRKSLDSICNQTLQPHEVILVKDGPLGRELEDIISEFIANYAFIKIIALDKNLGLSFALNEGLRHIKTEFIARMDSDDICVENRFQKQYDFLISNPEIDCVGSWAIEIDSIGQEYFRKRMPEKHEECVELFKKRDFLIHPSVMFRKKYFDKAGFYPTDTYFAEDTMMWANGLICGCKFANIQEYLLYFRLGNDFFSRRRGIKHSISLLKTRKQVIRKLGFGYNAYFYAYIYACIKLLPKRIISICYKIFR